MTIKDIIGTIGRWGWDNLVPSFKKGGRIVHRRAVKPVKAIKPRRVVQKARRVLKK